MSFKKNGFNLVKMILTVFFVLSVFSCSAEDLEKAKLPIYTTSGSKVVLEVELAKTSQERQKGYMYREKVSMGQGMLFCFEEESIQAFWMKNTSVPLSIAYISQDGTVKEIYDLVPFSTKSVVSKYPVKYALEVPQGWFDIQGITVGSRVTIGE